MRKKRLIGLIAISIACMGILLFRLVQLQLVDTESFSRHKINLIEASVRQRSQEMVVDNGRGNFLDRSGMPLSYKTESVLVLFPFLKKMEWDAEKVARIVGVSVVELKEAINHSEEPFAFGEPDPLTLGKRQMDAINEMEIPGVFAVERKYPLERIPAAQLLGIIGENDDLLKSRYSGKDFLPRTLIGLSGLEKSFDEFLVAEGKSKLVYHVDGEGAPLFGINVKYIEPANPFYPINLKTSIDKDLQLIFEEAADQHNIKKGGLLLLDIETNSILTMVSRPLIDKMNPFGSPGIENMMVKQHIPGSVFKTVVAAAAIDHGLDQADRMFNCSKKINGEPDPKNHGMLNFTDSFARSCNRTFGEIAKELQEQDPLILEKYAEMLSIIGGVGWSGDVFHLEDFRQLQDEESGRVYLTDEARKDRNFAALSGIGQHEVRVSPLAVANMMATIARGGEKQMARAVLSVQYQNGTEMIDFPGKKIQGDQISPLTTMKLQKLLREVIVNEHGTGRWFKDLPYEVAGKSGTAETGILNSNEEELHNKWFAGYFPYEKPKYALVAVNLGVPENEGGVNLLFSELVKAVYDYNHQPGETRIR